MVAEAVEDLTSHAGTNEPVASHRRLPEVQAGKTSRINHRGLPFHHQRRLTFPCREQMSGTNCEPLAAILSSQSIGKHHDQSRQLPDRITAFCRPNCRTCGSLPRRRKLPNDHQRLAKPNPEVSRANPRPPRAEIGGTGQPQNPDHGSNHLHPGNSFRPETHHAIPGSRERVSHRPNHTDAAGTNEPATTAKSANQEGTASIGVSF